MGFTKYQKVESTELATPDQHERLSNELRRQGKTNMRDLTDEDRQAMQERLLDEPTEQ